MPEYEVAWMANGVAGTPLEAALGVEAALKDPRTLANGSVMIVTDLSTGERTRVTTRGPGGPETEGLGTGTAEGPATAAGARAPDERGTASATEGPRGPGEASGHYRIADAAIAQAWLVAESPFGAGPLSEYQIAGHIQDAANNGIITGGPDGTELSAECCTDRDGGPDSWRILVYVPALKCCLLSRPQLADECPTEGVAVLQHAADTGNELLSKAGAAGLLPGA
jgi:hypothetical protein